MPGGTHFRPMFLILIALLLAACKASPAPSPTAVAVATSTDAPSPTATATHSPSPTASATATSSPTDTATATATSTPAPTDTPTPTSTPTSTPTATATSTPTPIDTITPTPTTLDTDQDEFPLHLDLIPGKLSAHVYVHDVETLTGNISCWSYVSDGLWDLGQKEMILTLQRTSGEAPEDYPEGPLEFFTAVYGLAEQGQLVDVGDITEFAGDVFLGYRGLAYIQPQLLDGVDVPMHSIAAILLQAEEVDTVRDFGMTRVLSRLGSAYRYYPCPPWSDRSRPGVWFPNEEEESVLAQVRRVNASGVSVLRDGDRIVLRVFPRGRGGLQKLLQLPSDVVVALLTEMEPTVKACLVWRPGQTQPEVITTSEADASVITGNFIAFVPQQQEDGGLLIEDGFVMMLTDASWAAIRQALEMGKEVAVPATQDGMSLAVEWVLTDYVSPIDGTTYHAEDGWLVYGPQSPSGEPEAPADLKEITLLTAELDRRVGTQSMVDYVTAVVDTVQVYFSSLEPAAGQDLVLELEINPEGVVTLKLASKPGIPDEMLEALHDQVLALSPPEVREGPIKFQLHFRIWE